MNGDDVESSRDIAQDERMELLEKRVSRLEAALDKQRKAPATDLESRVNALYNWIDNGQRF